MNDSDRDDFDEYYPDECYPECPACGDDIQHCQGHGEIGDPDGAAILALHDDGNHSRCALGGCGE